MERAELSAAQRSDLQGLVDFYVGRLEEGGRCASAALAAISQVLLVLGYTLETTPERGSRWRLEEWRP